MIVYEYKYVCNLIKILARKLEKKKKKKTITVNISYIFVF